MKPRCPRERMTDSTHKMEYYTTWNIKNFKERMYLETDTERLPGNIVKWEEGSAIQDLQDLLCKKYKERWENRHLSHYLRPI